MRSTTIINSLSHIKQPTSIINPPNHHYQASLHCHHTYQNPKTTNQNHHNPLIKIQGHSMTSCNVFEIHDLVLLSLCLRVLLELLLRFVQLRGFVPKPLIKIIKTHWSKSSKTTDQNPKTIKQRKKRAKVIGESNSNWRELWRVRQLAVAWMWQESSRDQWHS